MKEVTFIRQNIEKWKRAETMVEQAESLSPDELADAYTELTADLAFAQTHFPASRITIYLNNLASATSWTEDVFGAPMKSRQISAKVYSPRILKER